MSIILYGSGLDVKYGLIIIDCAGRGEILEARKMNLVSLPRTPLRDSLRSPSFES